LLWRKASRSSVAAPLTKGRRCPGSRLATFLNLARRDPHDMDGVADHVGGALLAFRASGHLFDSCRAALAGGAFSMVEVRAIGSIFVSAMDATQLPNVLIMIRAGAGRAL